MPKLKDDIPQGFTDPTALPRTPEQAYQWQEANRAWWETHPMRYDWTEEIGFEEFSKEFYAEIDRRFFSSASEFMPWKRIPFDCLIDFDSLKDKDVLEIGIGNGSHAQLFAQYARSFTGIDLTDYAVESTSRRMQLAGLDATVLRMDAEHMQFDDASFDVIWAWGVIHHSSDTRRVLEEMRRVLRPAGQAVVMVYHRTFFNYYVRGSLALLHRVLQGDSLRAVSLHTALQQQTDGAIARSYSISEWRMLVSDSFEIESITVLGNKSGLVLLPGGKLKNVVVGLVPNGVSRFLNNRCKLGDFLVSTLKKR